MRIPVSCKLSDMKVSHVLSSVLVPVLSPSHEVTVVTVLWTTRSCVPARGDSFSRGSVTLFPKNLESIPGDAAVSASRIVGREIIVAAPVITALDHVAPH